jgi:signal peptidase
MQKTVESSVMPIESSVMPTEVSSKKWGGCFRKIINVIAAFLCVCFGSVLIINVTLILQSFINESKVPDVFGYFPLAVLSDSMYPVIEGGDMAIYQKEPTSKMSVGDIVVFFDPADSSHQSLVTHRIVEIVNEDGQTQYKTKGDANNTEDSYLVSSEDIVGIYKNKISNAGNVALFMQTTKGMLVCIVLPLCIMVLFDSLGRGKGEKTSRPAES